MIERRCARAPQKGVRLEMALGREERRRIEQQLASDAQIMLGGVDVLVESIARAIEGASTCGRIALQLEADDLVFARRAPSPSKAARRNRHNASAHWFRSERSRRREIIEAIERRRRIAALAPAVTHEMHERIHPGLRDIGIGSQIIILVEKSLLIDEKTKQLCPRLLPDCSCVMLVSASATTRGQLIIAYTCAPIVDT